jgi:hypothetical protein
MKKIVKQQPFPKSKLIKVQLNRQTIIYIKHLSALKTWLERFPEAKVI